MKISLCLHDRGRIRAFCEVFDAYIIDLQQNLHCSHCPRNGSRYLACFPSRVEWEFMRPRCELSLVSLDTEIIVFLISVYLQNYIIITIKIYIYILNWTQGTREFAGTSVRDSVPKFYIISNSYQWANSLWSLRISIATWSRYHEIQALSHLFAREDGGTLTHSARTCSSPSQGRSRTMRSKLPIFQPPQKTAFSRHSSSKCMASVVHYT